VLLVAEGLVGMVTAVGSSRVSTAALLMMMMKMI
jgi:hypothetical protein